MIWNECLEPFKFHQVVTACLQKDCSFTSAAEAAAAAANINLVPAFMSVMPWLLRSIAGPSAKNIELSL